MGILTRATKNLYRRKTRTTIVITALTLALMLIIILPPSINARQELTNNALDTLTGSAEFFDTTLTLSATEIDCGHPITPELISWEENNEIKAELVMKRALMDETLITDIIALPDVVDVITTILDPKTHNRPYDIYGVAVNNPAFQKDLSILPTNITTGRTLQLEDHGVIVIDEFIAKNSYDFGTAWESWEDLMDAAAQWGTKPYIFNVGDTFEISGHSFTIVGIEGAGFLQDSHGITMSLADAQMVLDKIGEVSACKVFVTDIDNVNSVVARIKGLDSNLEVTSGITQINSVQPMRDQIATLTLAAENNVAQVWRVGMVEIGVSAVAATAVILFLMLYSVRERTREIGTLKAIGASTSKILGQFLLEGLLLSVVAAAIALSLSTSALAPIASLILPAPVREAAVIMWDSTGTMTLQSTIAGHMPTTPGEMPASIITATLSIEWLATCFGVAMLLGVLGSLYPALKAARTKPAEAMRYE